MQLSRGRLLILASLAAAYVFFLAWYHCPYAGGSDSSGYMNGAKLLLEGRLSTPVRVPPSLAAENLPRSHFMPLGFRLDPAQENLQPTYPIGLPLHFAAVGRLTGLASATTVVGVASALTFALLLYFTGREFGLSPGWSQSLALLGAMSPLVLQYALQAMSDLVAACWALAVILCALRSSRHAGWAVAAGASLAMAVLVRPTNALLVLPAVLALHRTPRTWIAFGLGGVPGALFLAWYNHAQFGSFLASGYGNVSTLFDAKWIPLTLAHYARWVPVVATPLVLAALGLPWVRMDRWKKATLLAWGGSLLLFYSAYECTNETWWYLRFILPALPALGLAATLVLQQVNFPSWRISFHRQPTDTAPTPATPGASVPVRLTFLLLLAAAGWMAHWTRALRVPQTELDDRTYPLVAQWVNEHVPANAMLAAYQASGSLLYYTDRPFLVPINLAPENHARFSAWLDREHRPFYAVVFPIEEADFRQLLPGRWEVATHIRHVAIWRRLAPGETPAKP